MPNKKNPPEWFRSYLEELSKGKIDAKLDAQSELLVKIDVRLKHMVSQQTKIILALIGVIGSIVAVKAVGSPLHLDVQGAIAGFAITFIMLALVWRWKTLSWPFRIFVGVGISTILIRLLGIVCYEYTCLLPDCRVCNFYFDFIAAYGLIPIMLALALLWIMWRLDPQIVKPRGK